MTEATARIASGNTVAITGDVHTLSAKDAMLLGRELLASAAALVGPEKPAVGAIVSDAHFPVVGFTVGLPVFDASVTLALAVLPGVV